MAGSVLTEQYVDIVARNLRETMDALKAIQKQADMAGESFKKLKSQAGGVMPGGTMPKSGKEMFGGAVGQIADGITGIVKGAAVAALAGFAAAAAVSVMSVQAADPGVFEQLNAVFHDIAGTVGQLLAPTFRAMVPVIRAVADVLAGVADAFRPVFEVARQAVIPVIRQLVAAFGQTAGQIAAVMLPLATQIAAAVTPVGKLMVTLAQAMQPLAAVAARLLTGFVSVGVSLVTAVTPAVTVVAAAFGQLAEIFGEVVALVYDVGTALGSAFGDLMAPVGEFVNLMANTLVAAIRQAVAGFRAMVDTFRLAVGLNRMAPVGTANSVGRGMLNQTGTEDANATFNRIQEAVLRAGMQDEVPPEVEHLKSLDTTLKEIWSFIQRQGQQIRDVANSPPAVFAEGALTGGVLGIAGMIGAVVTGNRGR